MTRSGADALQAVFIDRDDTILVDTNYMSDAAAIQLVDGAHPALLRLAEAGLGLVLISNQSGVGRGWIRRDQVQAIEHRMCELLPGVRFDGFEYCFHRPDEGCGCRKPSPEMILRAARRLGLEPARCVMLGDKAKDVQAGAAAGCWTALVSQDPQQAQACDADLVAADLAAAAAWVLGLAGARQARS